MHVLLMNVEIVFKGNVCREMCECCLLDSCLGKILKTIKNVRGVFYYDLLHTILSFQSFKLCKITTCYLIDDMDARINAYLLYELVLNKILLKSCLLSAVDKN